MSAFRYIRHAAALAGTASLVTMGPAYAQEADEQRIQQLEAQARDDARRIEQLEAELSELRDLVHAAVRVEEPVMQEDLINASRTTPLPQLATATGSAGAQTDRLVESLPSARSADRVLLAEAVDVANGRVEDASTFIANTDELPVSVGSNSTVALSTSTTSSRVALNLNIDSSLIRADDLTTGGERHTIFARSVDLVASAPVAEGEEPSQLFSLSGPEDGFTLGLTTNFQRFRFGRAPSNRIAENRALFDELFVPLREPAMKACMQSKDANGNNRSRTRCEYLLVQDGPRLFLDSFDPTTLTGADRITNQQKANYDLITGSVPPITLEDGPIVSLGLSGQISYGEFTFFDPTVATLIKNEERVGFQAGVSGSLIFPESNYSLSASAAFQRNYKASPNQAVCPLDPEDDATFIACPVRAFGEPKRDDSLLLRGEWRYKISESFAISPHAVFDALDNEFRVELPIYLIPDKDSELTGGVRIAHDSEEDDEFILGVFVSSPLEF